MYLKKLYQQNKFWFVIVSLFAILQLVNNIRQDVAITPVYQYGMFSEVVKPEKNYLVFEFFVNGTLLQTKNFSPQQWDKIIVPIQLFSKQKEWNSYWFHNDIQRLLNVSDSSKYMNDISQQQFNNWYKDYLQALLNEKVNSVIIQFNQYQFNESQFIKLQTINSYSVE